MIQRNDPNAHMARSISTKNFETKRTEFPLKLDKTYAYSLTNRYLKEENHNIYSSTLQRPHAEVHNSTGYTPGVLNQTIIKEF